MKTELDRSILKAAMATEAILGEMRQGIDRAFDVIHNHTVHTKGYVMTALKFIEEYGTSEDKIALSELLQSKNGEVAAGPVEPAKKAPNTKKK
jgi:hypothetical protein